MTFSQLFNKIGKQPMSITNHKQVVAIIERDGKYETIPLKLKIQTDNEQKIWLVEDKHD